MALSETTLEPKQHTQLSLLAIYLISNKESLLTLQNFTSRESIIQYQFKSKSLLLEAITHNSFVNEFKQHSLKNNERLEFVGDALVGLLVAEELFMSHPDETEGALSKMRASIVHEKLLSELALFLGLPDYILLGKGELKSGANLLPSLLSNLFEALMGSIYLDGGIDEAHRVFWAVVKSYQESKGIDLLSLSNLENFDPKTRLQELTMSLYKSLPRYESKQFKNDLFTITLFINNRELVTVEANSKKRGESIAAQKVIEEKLYILEPQEK